MAINKTWKMAFIIDIENKEYTSVIITRGNMPSEKFNQIIIPTSKKAGKALDSLEYKYIRWI